MKSGLRKFGLLALVLALLCGLAETIFYGGEVDANGVIQESLFLPLTFIFGAIGIVLVVLSLFFRRA